jgi:hypothetical protein
MLRIHVSFYWKILRETRENSLIGKDMEEQQSTDSQLKKARIFWFFMLINIVMIVGFAFIFPEGTNRPNEGAIVLTWILVVLMPFEIGLQFLFYNYFSSKRNVQYALGGSFIITMLGLGIALYGMLIRLLDTSFSQTGWLMSIILSFLALGLGWIFTTNLFSRFEFERESSCGLIYLKTASISSFAS